MNDEVRETAHIRMKPSIVRKAHQKAEEEGKTLGRWIEDVIEQRLEREREEKQPK
jgi:predicted HicB family RNase H-like nuclease